MEEQSILRANPYTYKVGESQISFTKEFKQLFWEEYQRRERPTKIFERYGYDTNILGRNRITGFQQCLKRDFEQGLEFRSGSRPAGARQEATAEDESYPSTIKELQHRLSYLEEEVEFLKKISSIKNTRK